MFLRRGLDRPNQLESAHENHFSARTDLRSTLRTRDVCRLRFNLMSWTRYHGMALSESEPDAEPRMARSVSPAHSDGERVEEIGLSWALTTGLGG